MGANLKTHLLGSDLMIRTASKTGVFLVLGIITADINLGNQFITVTFL